MSRIPELPFATQINDPRLFKFMGVLPFQSVWVILILCWSGIPAIATGAEAPVPRAFLAHASDHGFMWWPYGWRGRSPEGHRVFCVQTDRYGLAFDVDDATLTHLGPIRNPLSETQAVAQSNDVVFNRPPVRLLSSFKANGHTYRIVGLAPEPGDVQIIDHGRFLQRIRLNGPRFEDEDGNPPPGHLTASYELICWPDRVAILLRIRNSHYLHDPSITLGVQFANDEWELERASPQAHVAHLTVNEAGLALLRLANMEWTPDDPASEHRALALRTRPESYWEGDRTRTAGLVLLPFSSDDAVPLKERIRTELEPQEGRTVRATGITPYAHLLEVRHDPYLGAYVVRLGEVDGDGWSPSRDRDRLERVRLAFDNGDDVTRTVRLLFSRESEFRGLVGFTPMLRDPTGLPIGLPVQISKNWHDHHWFHGATIAQLPADQRLEAEFAVTYAHWGGVPAVSHAQLCLVGWGVNQLWHQVAIGSFGESICYDPDVCLGRSMIDDMRPLLVKGWTRPDWWNNPKWGWTNNVGGGDFLVYFDEQEEKQFLSRMKTSYLRYGPNLSEVIYAGCTPGGEIEASISVIHARSDDYVRGIYQIRYDVTKPMGWKRLAFFQLGADLYNDHQFNTIARGHAGGLVEEWPVEWGEPGYNRSGIACEGRLPWFSLHDSVGKPLSGEGTYQPKLDGAWANRGIVIRKWSAQMGGQDIQLPYASEYRTANGPPSALIELGPPPQIARLEPGDFVEAEIELLILPRQAGDYYGPNEALKQALPDQANTWRLVHREAVGNDLSLHVSRGHVVRSFPPLIRCDDQGQAEFTLEGGLGYVPVTLSGVPDYRRCVLERRTPSGWIAIDQSVHGNDFWQSEYDQRDGTWALTYNISCDLPGAEDGIQAFRLR